MSRAKPKTIKISDKLTFVPPQEPVKDAVGNAYDHFLFIAKDSEYDSVAMKKYLIRLPDGTAVDQITFRRLVDERKYDTLYSCFDVIQRYLDASKTRVNALEMRLEKLETKVANP